MLAPQELSFNLGKLESVATSLFLVQMYHCMKAMMFLITKQNLRPSFSHPRNQAVPV